MWCTDAAGRRSVGLVAPKTGEAWQREAGAAHRQPTALGGAVLVWWSVAMGEALDLVLADDQVMLTDALTGLVEHDGHHVLAAASSWPALVKHVRALRPDVCITDTRFADGDCLELLGDLVRASPATKIVILTGDSSTETMQRALQAGVSAIVHKSRRVAVLLDVLRRVASGEVVVEGSFMRPGAEHGAAPQLRRLTGYLTGRELECLALLTKGMDTRTMAAHLGVSRTTIRSHIQAVLTKLGVHSRLEAAALAVQFGLAERPAHQRRVNER